MFVRDLALRKLAVGAPLFLRVVWPEIDSRLARYRSLPALVGVPMRRPVEFAANRASRESPWKAGKTCQRASLGRCQTADYRLVANSLSRRRISVAGPVCREAHASLPILKNGKLDLGEIFLALDSGGCGCVRKRKWPSGRATASRIRAEEPNPRRLAWHRAGDDAYALGSGVQFAACAASATARSTRAAEPHGTAVLPADVTSRQPPANRAACLTNPLPRAALYRPC